MKKIYLILSLIFIFCLDNKSYAIENGSFVSDLTIKELSENVEKLKEEKNEFQEKNKELAKEYGDLVSFIKKDLTDDEILEIKGKVEIFMQERKGIQKQIKEKIDNLEDTSKEKRDLLVHIAHFYKYLATYVQKEKKEEFIAHIKFQIQSEKESKDLIEEFLKSQNILDNKVNYIKEKIEIHKEDLQSKIEIKILSKIKDRIDQIDTDKKYDMLDQASKNKIYSDFIEQIDKKIADLQESNLSENYKKMKNNLLEKMKSEILLKIKK